MANINSNYTDISYKYRKVICPYCRHEFVWQQSVQEESTWAEYTDKITKEICLSAKCPECSRKMIVSKDSAVGINEDSEKYTKTIVRGI